MKEPQTKHSTQQAFGRPQPNRIFRILPLFLYLVLSAWPATSAAAPPTVTGFWPPNGTAGTIVFVFGSDFGLTSDVTQIQVNGIGTSVVQSFTNGLLFFMLPVGNTNGPICLSTAQGSACSATSFGTTPAGVAITSIWPGQGAVGAPVFVFGAGFDPAPGKTNVSLAGTPAPFAHVVDASLIVFMVPPGATSGAVRVTTPLGSATSATSFVPRPSCSITQLEAAMDTVLAQTVSEVDFSFSVERQDGRRYNFNRGVSTLQTSYQSASTSKLVSAVIILRLVEQGYLKLSDRPQDHIGTWPIAGSDSLYNMTLAQLLSFTSGLTVEPTCLNSGNSNLGICVINIANANAGNGISPGRQFYYASTHLQVAGLMAVKARGVATWQDVFTEFKTQTGLFSTASYDLPSLSNPRLAGGMHWTGEEYMAFLKALKNGSLLNSVSMSQLLTDHTASSTIGYSPTVLALREDWHYGFGLWHECQSATFNCIAGTRLSSPGAYGAYPFWDKSIGYIGILARQGLAGTFRNGIAIERSVRSNVEQWVACQ